MARPTAWSGGDSLKHGRGAPVGNWKWDQLSGFSYQPPALSRQLKQNLYHRGHRGTRRKVGEPVCRILADGCKPTAVYGSGCNSNAGELFKRLAKASGGDPAG